MRVLGIETSCDETGVALYCPRDGLLAQRLHSQVRMHERYGGVVPELASRDHVQRLAPMIEDTLAGAKATRYRHAARHLLECRTLEASIGEHGSFETHDAFVARLQARHGRKTGFWSRVTELGGT